MANTSQHSRSTEPRLSTPANVASPRSPDSRNSVCRPQRKRGTGPTKSQFRNPGNHVSYWYNQPYTSSPKPTLPFWKYSPTCLLNVSTIGGPSQSNGPNSPTTSDLFTPVFPLRCTYTGRPPLCSPAAVAGARSRRRRRRRGGPTR